MSESDKSGKPELTAKPIKPMYEKPQLYAHYFGILKQIAKEFGYNLVIHGSMNRDLDLVAIAWIDNPKDELKMIQCMDRELTGQCKDEPKHYLFAKLPGNRHSYVIDLNRGGYYSGKDENGDKIYEPDPQYYIDISIPQTG